MNFGTVLYESKERVATITLNRPDKLNAYIVAMGEEVVGAFDRLRDDENSSERRLFSLRFCDLPFFLMMESNPRFGIASKETNCILIT